MIALALACRPSLVIADEPTTALDVVMQAQILELLERLRAELGLALILISHDLSVLAETCDRIAVMYAGRIVETGPVDAVFSAPQHPYTKRLLESLPVIGGSRTLGDADPGRPARPGRRAVGLLVPARAAPTRPSAARRSRRCARSRRRSRRPATSRPGSAGPSPSSWRRSPDDAAHGGRATSPSTSRRAAASRRRSTACRSSGGAARSSASWGSRAAASPRSRARCSGSCRRRRAAVAADGAEVGGRAAPAGAAPQRPDDLPGPLPDAEPAPPGRATSSPRRWS